MNRAQLLVMYWRMAQGWSWTLARIQDGPTLHAIRVERRVRAGRSPAVLGRRTFLA